MCKRALPIICRCIAVYCDKGHSGRTEPGVDVVRGLAAQRVRIVPGEGGSAADCLDVK